MVVDPVYQRLTAAPRQTFFLFGVRGVGKSTWARIQFPKAYRIDLLDEARFHDLLADPSMFASDVRANASARQWVVLDEIQRLPGLLNEVHRLIEDRRQRFVLLGSSARKLKTAGTNLLAGRALWKTMFPLLPEELGRDFNLERVLRYGSIPLIWNSPEPRQSLDAYVRVYLREEVRAEALVRNLPPLPGFCRSRRFFTGRSSTSQGLLATPEVREPRCQDISISSKIPC
jgi:predicted AAA+ superfamily ATPase